MVEVGRQKYLKFLLAVDHRHFGYITKVTPPKKNTKKKKTLVINSPILLHNNKGPEWEEEGEWRMAGKR